MRGTADIDAIWILGRTGVGAGDRTVEIAAPKERVVLTALALAAPRGLTPGELVSILWDDPPSTAAKTLQNYIARLRRAVGGHVVVTLPSGAYAIDVEPMRVDALRFEHQVQLARVSLRDGRIGQADRAARDAVELWHGPPACGDSTGYGLGTVRRFEEQWALLQELRGEIAIELDADPVPDLELAVAADPLRERLWELLVTALAKQGRQTDALRAAERARQTLVDVGLEPGPGLRDAIHSVVGGDGLRRRSARMVPDLPAPLRRDSSFPLVGRESVVRRLNEAWIEASRGEPRIVVIEAPAGAGKTRLLAELLSTASCDEANVAAAIAGDRPMLPYDVLGDLLRSLPAPSGLTTALVDGPARVGDAPAHRATVLEGLRVTLSAASSAAPTLVVVDDLHWADASTVRSLADVAPLLRGRVLLAVALRPSGLERPEMIELAAVLRRQQHTDWLALPDLDDRAVHDLVVATNPEERDPASVARTLTRRTGGNAFLVRALLEDGASAWDAESVPAAARDVIGARSERLPEDVRAALRVGAVCGQEVDATVVGAVLGIDMRDAALRLDAASRAGFLAEGAGATGYRFAHDLTRQAVYDALPRIERAMLHLAIADTIVLRADDAALAHHLVAAGELADPARTLHACATAALRAADRCGFAEAAAWTEAALEAEDRLPPDGARRARLLLDHGTHLLAAGAPVEGRDAIVTASELAPDDATDVLFAVLHSYLGAPGTYVEADDPRLQRLVARAARVVTPERADRRCQVLCAEVALRVDGRARRLEIADEAVAVARELDDPALLADALGTSWLAGQGVRDGDAQLALAREWYLHRGGRDGGVPAVVPLVRLWAEQIGAGAIDDALSSVADLDALARSTHWRSADWYSVFTRSVHAHLDGDDATAIAGVLELASRTDTPGPGTALSLASLRLRLGELSEDETLAAPARDTFRHVGAVGRGIAVHARDALAAGDEREAARRLARWAIEGLPAMPPSTQAYNAAVVAPIAARCAGAEVLRALLEVLEPMAGRWAMMNLVVPLGRYELASGLVRSALGDVDGAVEDLAAAHAGHVAAGAAGLAASSAAALRDALAARGQPRDHELLATLD